jgi:hypothetical protein
VLAYGYRILKAPITNSFRALQESFRSWPRAYKMTFRQAKKPNRLPLVHHADQGHAAKVPGYVEAGEETLCCLQ